MASSPAFTTLKQGVKFFLIGAVFALCAPTLGSWIGLAPTAGAARGELGKMGDPLLVGLVFGVIAALDTSLKPLFKKWFPANPERPSAEP